MEEAVTRYYVFSKAVPPDGHRTHYVYAHTSVKPLNGPPVFGTEPEAQAECDRLNGGTPG